MGAAVGPLVGGVLLQFFWWGSVFLAAIPVMALLLVLGPRLLPEYRDPEAGKLDLASVALSLVSVLSLVYAFKQMAEQGFEAGLIALAVLGAGVGWLFVRRQRGLAYPLLDMTLFSQPAFGVAVAVYGLAGLTMFGVYIFITQYLQGVLGLSALNAGLATVPWALGFMGGSLFTGRLTRWMPPTSVLVWGCALAALGFALIAVAHGTWALGVMVAGMVVMSLGMAPVITVINEIIITSAPPERAGSASALSETSGEFSGALGVAIFGSLGMAFYRHSLAEAAPAGLPEATLQVSLSTLGGAVSAAHALPGPMGDALLTAARQSFSHALQLTAAIGAVLLVVASVVSARVIKRAASRVPAD
jgi:DHA2 family multidrug resistance protein-like MFS transporter